MASWVNSVVGIPTPADFATTQGQGAAICIDQTTGNAYYLLPGNIVTQISGGNVWPQPFGAVGDGVTDNTTVIQNAINSVAGTGGTLYFPPGVFAHSGLIFKNKVTIQGAGRDTGSTLGTVLLYTGTGDGIQVNNPINSSTPANISVRGITFKNQNVNAGKGCFADTGSTDIKFKECSFIGSDRGLIFDQSELFDVTECDFEGVTGQTCLIWIVNGADRTVGASAGFTNRGSIQRCQLNGRSGTILVVDDGGGVHTFADNNYNGGQNHMRAAGVGGLIINGGEWESASSNNLLLYSTSLLGTSVGSCGPVKIHAALIVPTVGNSCIYNSACGTLVMDACYLGNSTAAKVVGAANINTVIALGTVNAGGGATFDNLATNHFQVDNGGSVITNLGGFANIAAGTQLVFLDSSGSTFEAYEERTQATPYRWHDLVSLGGTGAWQGGFRVRVNYNNGSLVEAFKCYANTNGTTATTVLGGSLQVPNIAGSAADTPPSGYTTLFVDTADGKLKRKDSTSAITIIG